MQRRATGIGEREVDGAAGTSVKGRMALSLTVIMAALVVVMMLAPSNPAWAATFTVTKTADTNDGSCLPTVP